MKTLGLDIGHCISAGACFDENNKGTYRIEGKNSQKTITTQLMLTSEQLDKLKKNLNGKGYPGYKFLGTIGEFKIGEDVEVQTEGGRVFRYFKTHPAAFNELYGEDEQEKKELRINHGTLMACFCFALLNQYIEKSNGMIDSREKLKLIVGCPATKKWTSAKAKKEYAELVKKATGVNEVEIVPESRGALFGIVNSNSAKKISVAKGVIVFDFGSSTADCTYMLLGKRLAEFSWDLGASYIEREMLKKLRDSAEKHRESGLVPVFEESVLDKLRVIKEKYFRGAYTSKVPGEYTIKFENAAGEVVKGEYVGIYNAFMDDTIFNRTISIACGETSEKTGSWSELCKEFFEEARNIIIEQEKFPVDAIVLTGGASQMGFIKEKCYDVFKIEPVNDENVEYAVSDGLAWVSASEEKYPEFFEKAKNELEVNKKCEPDLFLETVKNSITDYIYSTFQKEAFEWKNKDYNLSLNWLSNKVVNQIRSEQEQLEIIINEEKERISENIDKEIKDVVNKYVKGFFSPEITKVLSYDLYGFNVPIAIKKDDIKLIVKNIDIRSFMSKSLDKFLDELYFYWFSGDWIEKLFNYRNKKKNEEQHRALDKNKRTVYYDRLLQREKKITEEISKKVDYVITDSFAPIVADFPGILTEKLEKAFRVAMLMDFEKIGWSD